MEKQQIFREKIINQISSPDELNEYLKVASPSVWVILAAVILLLFGVIVWASTGTLETRSDAYIEASANELHVYVSDNKSEFLSSGDIVRVQGQECVITDVQKDETGRTYGIAALKIADGVYNGEAVVETIRPISFLFR